jgi:hypothetical protein
VCPSIAIGEAHPRVAGPIDRAADAYPGDPWAQDGIHGLVHPIVGLKSGIDCPTNCADSPLKTIDARTDRDRCFTNPIDALGNAIDGTIRRAGEAINAIDKPIDRVGEPIQRVAEAIYRVGERIQRVAEAIRRVGRPIGQRHDSAGGSPVPVGPPRRLQCLE